MVSCIALLGNSLTQLPLSLGNKFLIQLSPLTHQLLTSNFVFLLLKIYSFPSPFLLVSLLPSSGSLCLCTSSVKWRQGLSFLLNILFLKHTIAFISTASSPDCFFLCYGEVYRERMRLVHGQGRNKISSVVSHLWCFLCHKMNLFTSPSPEAWQGLGTLPRMTGPRRYYWE